jgi:hypothetical protein
MAGLRAAHRAAGGAMGRSGGATAADVGSESSSFVCLSRGTQ